MNLLTSRSFPFDQHSKCPVPHSLRPTPIARRGIKKGGDFVVNGKSIFQPGDRERRPIIRWPIRSEAFHYDRAAGLTGVLRVHKTTLQAGNKCGVLLHIANPSESSILPTFRQRSIGRAALSAQPEQS